MKSIALTMAVVALLSPDARADAHSEACKRIREAGDKVLSIVQKSFGPNGGNSAILNGVVSQAKGDLESGRRWSEKLATINVDPQTGEPVDCGAIAAKHQAFLAAYPSIPPKFETAAQLCVDTANAGNGKCGSAASAAFKARDAFIRASVLPFLQAERAAPPYCRSSNNGSMSGATTAEPCARPAYSGGRVICSALPLKDMKNAADDACKLLSGSGTPGKIKGLGSKIKGAVKKVAGKQPADVDPILVAARSICTPLNEIRDNLEKLRANANTVPSGKFLESAISAAVVHKSLVDLKQTCDSSPGTYADPAQ